MKANSLGSTSETRELCDQDVAHSASPEPTSGLRASESPRCLADLVRAIEEAVRLLAIEGMVWPKREIYSAGAPSGQTACAAHPDSGWFPFSSGVSPLAALHPDMTRHAGCKLPHANGENKCSCGQSDTHFGQRELKRERRILVTLLFTDIVGSTHYAETLGDEKWHRLLERHRTIVRRQLASFCGCEIEVPGDGFLATFDSPTNAVKCARAIRAALRPIGLEIRAGLHAGECKVTSGRLVGIAVHIAARVVRIAAAGQILVSSTVRELAFGSGLHFSAEVIHALKGLTESWHLFELSEDFREKESSTRLAPSRKKSNGIPMQQVLN